MPLSIYSSVRFTKLNREGIKLCDISFQSLRLEDLAQSRVIYWLAELFWGCIWKHIILTVLLKLNPSILNGVTPHTLPPLPMLLTWKKSFAICILRYLIFMIKESWPHKKPYQILGEISRGNAKRCWFTIYFKVQCFLLFQHCPAVSLFIN